MFELFFNFLYVDRHYLEVSMQIIFSRLFFIVLLIATKFNFAYMCLDLLKQQNNIRYTTFSHLFEILSTTKPKIIVETGTARQGISGLGVNGESMDGASTLLFTEFAKKLGCQFYSVDINAEHLAFAKATCINLFGNDISTQFIHQDSVDFLRNFPSEIDCLYLDSFNFDFNNPEPSQTHHLKEIQAAYPKLSKHCVIMIDDCNLPHGGKGAKVIPWLKERGWKVIHNAYQVILVRN